VRSASGCSARNIHGCDPKSQLAQPLSYCHPIHANGLRDVDLGYAVAVSSDGGIFRGLRRTTRGRRRQLADYARRLRALFSPVLQDIARLDRDIKAAREHTASVASQALTDAKQHLEEFKAGQTRAEVLDLRVAIWAWPSRRWAWCWHSGRDAPRRADILPTLC
jgi:hypothetical protein